MTNLWLTALILSQVESAQPQEMIQMLESGKRHKAAAAVEAHWLDNIAPMLAAIEATSEQG